MNIRILISVAFLITFSSLNAQQKGKFAFEEETFDFGDIKEENGSVTHKFVFTNEGDAPLIIEAVSASCGCTTPAWSREPIFPRGKGFVTAKYDPTNRPGKFKKSLTISSNANISSKTIFIKGMVEQKIKTAADLYRTKIGDLRLRYQSLNMGKVTTQKPLTRSFELYNDGNSPITFLEKFLKPDHIILSIQPKILEPKEKGKLIITYDAKGKDDFGFVSDAIRIYTDENTDAEKRLRVIATIEEYFPPLTAEEVAQAPNLKFEKTTHNFGSVKENKTVQTLINFTNTGKSELNIRSIKPNCGCTVAKMEKDAFAPGESGTLQIEFNAQGRRGSQQKSIVIFSNDPIEPTQRLIIKAKVLDAS